MRNHPCWLVMAFMFAIHVQIASAETAGLSNALSEFWRGVNVTWMPANDGDAWTEEQRNAVRAYCKGYAKEHSPDEVLALMIDDLAEKPSEVNAFVYTWVVLNWDPHASKAILKPIHDGGDPLKRQIASDFLASIEEAEDCANR